jgi:hypothetical protein
MVREKNSCCCFLYEVKRFFSLNRYFFFIILLFFSNVYYTLFTDLTDAQHCFQGFIEQEKLYIKYNYFLLVCFVFPFFIFIFRWNK